MAPEERAADGADRAASPTDAGDPVGALLAVLPLPVLRFDRPDHVVGANVAARVRWGHDEAWWRDRRLGDVDWDPGPLARWSTALAEAFATGEKGAFDHVEQLDGTTHALRVQVLPLSGSGDRRDPDGPTSVVAVCRDVTAEHDARQRAADDRELIDDLGEVADLVAVVDRDLRFRYVNHAVAAIAEREPDEIVGRTMADLGWEVDLTASLVAALRTAFETGTPATVQFHTEVTLTHIEARITPRRDEDGRVDRALVIAHDITDLLRARAEVEAERARLATTIESLFDPLVELTPVVDDEGELVDLEICAANRAAAAFLGAGVGDVVGARFLANLPPTMAEEVRRDHARMVETGQPLVLDDLVVRHVLTGEQRRIDLRAVLLDESLVVTWRDMTERRNADERFRVFAENASDVVIMAPGDVDATSWISPSVTRVLGWQPEDWIGCSPVDFIHPDDLERLMKDLEADRGLGQQVDDYRVRRPDGDYTWVSVSSSTVDDADGEVVLRVAVLRDITAAIAGRQRLAESEERYRLLVETMSDVIYQTDAHGIIEWVSPAVADVLGWDPDDLIGTSAFELVATEDRTRVDEPHHHQQPPGHPRPAGGATSATGEVRFRQADGRLRWMAVRARPFFADDGTPLGAVIGLRDCHDEVLFRRAVRTQEAGHTALASTDDEQELLELVCQAAVERGGYLFAWYGRRVLEDHRVVPAAASSEHRRYLERVDVRWDDGPLGQGPGGRSISSGRTVVFADLDSIDSFGPWIDAARDEGFRATICLPVRVDGEVDGGLMVYASEAAAFDERAVALLEDLTTMLGYGIKRIRDRVALETSLRERALLSTAIDQAGEAVVVTDPDATIVYANPAAARSSGYALDELVGSNPRVLQSGTHDPDFYAAMWRELTAGRPWHGTLVNRRKDGRLYEEEATITPVHDTDGTLTAYVGVKHDLTRERSLEAEVGRAQADREAIATLLRTVRASETLERTIDDFCAAAARLPFVDSSVVLLLTGDDAVLITGDDAEAVGRIPVTAVADFLDRTADGPWWLDLTEPTAEPAHPLVARVRDAGFRATAYAPILRGDRLLAVLGIASLDDDSPQWMPDRLSAVEELASFAATLFGAEVEQRGASEAARERIQQVIDERAFHPVFQPVVTADMHEVVGFEALTRFDDGTRPDLCFAEAHAVGLGVDLEVACATAALELAVDLPPDLWVSVNLSPAAVLSGRAAAPLHAPGRRIIVEITEHEPIESYPDLRAAIDACGGCEISVDDAGAGYASLRHILELQPDVVKLDIALVRDIDADPARQALAAGLCHFADQTGTTLIAEGVETEAEATVLASLGVDLMQGYRFGRPEPLPQPSA